MHANKILFGILVHALGRMINVIIYWVATCDEIQRPTKTKTINFGDKEATCKLDNFYFLLEFWLITILLLIIVSI